LKITILNGNSDQANRVFDDYLNGLHETLNMAGHFADLFNLGNMEIKQCTGCWNCWVKTPGRCSLNDDFNSLYRDIINCDLLIFASPVKMGFVSALLKRANDRLIPLVLPYFQIINHEFHHQKRYSQYPLLGLVLEKDLTTDDEDLEIISSIFNRTAINFHSQLKFTHLITDSEKELINAINIL
jgi:hypothetical protein